MPSKTKGGGSRRGAAKASGEASTSSSVQLPPLDDSLAIEERRIACIELKGAPVGPSCVTWAPDASSLTVVCGTVLHIISPALGVHPSLNPPLNLVRRADDPGSKVIGCFRTTIEVSDTANSASYDNGGHPIPLRDYSVVPVGTATDQWKTVSWSLERIGPGESYIVVALTVKGTVHLFSSSGNAVAGPFEQRDLNFQVTDSSDRSNIFKSRISALTWAPGQRLIGGNQAGELIVWVWDASSSILRLESRRSCAEGPILSLRADVEGASDDGSNLSLAIGGAGFLRTLRVDLSASGDAALSTTSMPGMKSRSATAIAWIGSRLLWTFPGFLCWHDPARDTHDVFALEAGGDGLGDPYAQACDIRRAQHPNGHQLIMLTLSAGSRYAFPEAYLDGDASPPVTAYTGFGPFETTRSFSLKPVGSIAPVHAAGDDKAELNSLERQVEVLRGLHGHAASTADTKTGVPSLGAYVHGADSLSLIPYHLVKHSLLTLVLTEPGPKQDDVEEAARLRSYLNKVNLEELSWPYLRAVMAFHATAAPAEREGTARAILDAILEAQDRSWGEDPIKGMKLLWMSGWLQRQPGSAKLIKTLSELISALRWRAIRARGAVELQNILKSAGDLKKLDKDDELYVRALSALGIWLIHSDKVLAPQPNDEADLKALNTFKKLAREALDRLEGGKAGGAAAFEALKADFEQRKEEGISIGDRCEACGDEVPLSLSSTAGGAMSAYDTCPRGHVWSRCNETYRLLCESRALRCAGCGAKATLMTEFDDERSEDVGGHPGASTGAGASGGAGSGETAPLLHAAMERAARCRDCGGLWVIL